MFCTAFCFLKGTKDWEAIDLSVDGNFLTGVVFDGYIYTSSNFGITWIEHKNAGYRQWSGIAVNNNGEYMIACIYGGHLQYSNNYGVTWIELKSSVIEFYRDITSDSTGNLMNSIDIIIIILSSSL